MWEGRGHFAFLGALVGALLVRDVLDGCGDGCRRPLQSVKWADGGTAWRDIAKGQRGLSEVSYSGRDSGDSPGVGNEVASGHMQHMQTK